MEIQNFLFRLKTLFRQKNKPCHSKSISLRETFKKRVLVVSSKTPYVTYTMIYWKLIIFDFCCGLCTFIASQTPEQDIDIQTFHNRQKQFVIFARFGIDFLWNFEQSIWKHVYFFIAALVFLNMATLTKHRILQYESYFFIFALSWILQKEHRKNPGTPSERQTVAQKRP